MESSNSEETHKYENHCKFTNKVPIIYSEGYNLKACGLEKMNPLDLCKFEKSK